MRRFVLSLVAVAAINAAPLGLPHLHIPKSNPQTKAKIELGQMLFFDPRFSADNTISCATCHDPDKAFTDQLPVSVGIGGKKGTRNAPTVINAAYFSSQFWDGRVPTLAEQAKFPPINPVEGGLHGWDEVVDKIKADPNYVKLFAEVFGIKKDEITIDHFGLAIEAFERTIIMGDSRFDRYYFQGEKDALSEQEKRGFALFLGKGRCVECHTISQNYALFTNDKFHNLGVGWKKIKDDLASILKAYEQKEKLHEEEAVLLNAKFSELGRYVVTKEIDDIGAFKTPTLRNIELTFPYMHDGSLKTLEEVIVWYNNGGRLSAADELSPFIDGGIRELNLTGEEIEDLVAFLKTLTSESLKKDKK